MCVCVCRFDETKAKVYERLLRKTLQQSKRPAVLLVQVGLQVVFTVAVATAVAGCSCLVEAASVSSTHTDRQLHRKDCQARSLSAQQANQFYVLQ
jgi:hypothetical protein